VDFVQGDQPFHVGVKFPDPLTDTALEMDKTKMQTNGYEKYVIYCNKRAAF